jgi:hypothetical protein
MAIRQPMVTFRDVSLSSPALFRPVSINDRSDRGAVTVLIFAPACIPVAALPRGVTRKSNSGDTKKNQTKM